MSTTKSKGRKDITDKFYTPSQTINTILSNLQTPLSSFDLIIEPSAGSGAFTTKLQELHNNIVSYDIHPNAPSIIQQDFLLLPPTKHQHNNILVIGNPPFGVQCNLAIDFINHAAKFASHIGFILPLSFKKPSIQNRINKNLHLIQEIQIPPDFILPDNTIYTVPCVFQLWQKKAVVRKIQNKKLTTKLFQFTTPENANLRVQRVGGNAGKAYLNLNGATSSNYFIKAPDPQQLADIINSLVFETIDYTVGPKSLSKTELIETIEAYLQTYHK